MTRDHSLSSTQSPLAELAKVISACCSQGKTPVIVCHRSITLADDFYLAICQAVHAQTGCHIRLDLLPKHRLAGMFGALCRSWHLDRLRRRLEGCGSVGTTIALSRINLSPSELVIGFAGPKDELPSYAKPIELAA